MILGIGCDILDIKRFKKAASAAFIRHVFTKAEQAVAQSLKEDKKWAYFAKRFAAKEACSKAVGTGIGKHIGWQDISILNNPQGAPVLKLSRKAKSFIQNHFKCQKFKIHISLSDDHQAMAFVIFEKELFNGNFRRQNRFIDKI